MNPANKARLYVLFSLGADRYALEACRVVCMLPWRPLKAIPAAPDWLVGCFVQDLVTIPVIDVSRQLSGVASSLRTSTRLVVIELDESRRIGLILEKASDTLRIDDEAFVSTLLPNQSPCLGPVAQTTQGLIQRVDAHALLTPQTCQWLFASLESLDA